MIKSTELREGNWLIYHGDTDMCCQVDAEDIFNIATGYMDNDKIHSPIPLTDEVLKGYGFDKAGIKEVNKDWMIVFEDGVVRLQVEGNVNYYRVCELLPLPHIKSLHQLQNLIYFLTGEELNYTPLKA